MKQLLLASICWGVLAFAPSALAQDGEQRCAPIETAIAAQAPPSRRRGRAASPSQVWTEANDAARQRPERGGFSSARYVYTYAPGALYELYANLNFISSIVCPGG